jgi:hypothetical protein
VVKELNVHILYSDVYARLIFKGCDVYYGAMSIYFVAIVLEFKERYRTLPFAKLMKRSSSDVVGNADQRRWKPIVSAQLDGAV